MGKFKKPERGSEKLQIGGFLLQDAPNQQGFIQSEEDKTVYIDMDKIRPNKNNKFSKEEIEDLAQLIKLGDGIWQNLIVKPEENGMYELTTGERRWSAAMLLRDRGEYPERFQNKVPCTVRNPDNLDLPLTPERKEMFSILLTNRYRDKTDGDRMMEYQEWKKIYEELRAHGVEVLYDDGTYLTKEEVRQADEGELLELQAEKGNGMQIGGVKTRQLIANAMNTSTGQVSRYEHIEKKASEAVLNSLLSDDINLGEAEQLSSLPKETQNKLVVEKIDKGKLSREKVLEEKKKCAPKVVLTGAALRNDTEELNSLVPGEGVELTEEQFKKYRKSIEQIKKILEVAEGERQV